MSAISKAQKSCKAGYYYCYTHKKCRKLPMGYYVGRGGYLSKDNDSDEETKNKNGGGNGNGNGSSGNGNGGSNGNSGTGGVSEEKTFAQRDKIMKKAKSLHKHLYKNLHKKDTSGDVNEGKTFKQFISDI